MSVNRVLLPRAAAAAAAAALSRLRGGRPLISQVGEVEKLCLHKRRWSVFRKEQEEDNRKSLTCTCVRD